MWYEDAEWTDRVEAFQQIMQSPKTRMCFDLHRLEEALYDPLMFKHIDVVLEQEANPDIDGRRYVSRLLMAIIVRMHELAAAEVGEAG